MAKPIMMQTLGHGKLLTAKNFPQFVETWNYMNKRLENIRGDRDVNPETGHIKVDNTDPEHPVIRLEGKTDGKSETEGVSETFSVVTSVAWNASSYRIVIKGREMTFKDGLLTELGEEQELDPILTTPWTGE